VSSGIRTGRHHELRPDAAGLGMVWDEIIAHNVKCFHLEAMDGDLYSAVLDFADGQQLMFTIGIQPKRRRLVATVTEEPR
jgi:hypothetical protein